MAFFLSGSFIGGTTLGAVALPSSYLNIQINGECKVGMIHISNYTKSDTELDAIDRTVAPAWSGTTLLRATFEDDSTDAGNITGISSIDSWDVYRRRSDESNFSKLASLSGDETGYIDYTAQADHDYKYQVYPITVNTIANVLETQFESADFYGWYLIDEDTDTAYKFHLEVGTGAISTTTDSSFVETQSQYPTHIENGNQNYERGVVQSMYGGINSTNNFEQSVDVLDELEAFINNGKEKILKSRKGHVWRVKTDSFSITPFGSENIRQQPYMIRFNWVEVADV